MKILLKDVTNTTHKNIKVIIHKREHKEILYGWLFDVTEEFNYHHFTFLTATMIIEKYTNNFVYDLTDYQLIGVTALFIAAKIEEISTKHIGIYEKITAGVCTKQQIFDMEKQILDYLGFDLNPLMTGTICKKHDVITIFKTTTHNQLTVDAIMYLFTCIVGYVCMTKKLPFEKIVLYSIKETKKVLRQKTFSGSFCNNILKNSELQKYFSTNGKFI